jgi:hypothetical protein
MAGADHKGQSMFFIHCLNSIFAKIILLYIFISLFEFDIFHILLLPLAIVGTDHSKDGFFNYVSRK